MTDVEYRPNETVEPGEVGAGPDGAQSVWVRGIELFAGMLLALGFFLLVLWLLNLGLPEATGLGDLVRHRDLVESTRRSANLQVAGDEGQAFIAMLSDVYHDVKEKPAFAVSWSNAHTGVSLEERHAIQSFDRSGATVDFEDGSQLQLGESSLIIVRKLRGRRQRHKRRVALTIVDGSLRGKLTPNQEGVLDLEVLTPGGTIRTRASSSAPADFNVTTEPDGSSTLAVYSGQAELKWGSETTLVPANHSVVFSEAHPPGQPVPLPRLPDLAAPADGAVYLYREVPPRIHFAWGSPDRTSKSRIQIARDREFNDLVHEELLSEREFTHGYLEAGDYYWRVNGVRGTAEGPAGPARRLEVQVDRDPPLLLVGFPETTIAVERIVLRGTTEPGSRVLISNEWVAPNDTGEFEYAMKLRNGYNLVVLQAVDPTGNTTFASGLIKAEF